MGSNKDIVADVIYFKHTSGRVVSVEKKDCQGYIDDYNWQPADINISKEAIREDIRVKPLKIVKTAEMPADNSKK